MRSDTRVRLRRLASGAMGERTLNYDDVQVGDAGAGDRATS